MNLTYDEIDDMEAGLEMDCLVAEKVMGNKVLEGLSRSGKVIEETPNGYRAEVSPYSTNFSYAWEVVEKIRGWSICETLKRQWVATCINPYPKKEAYIQAIANTAPLAICRAALKAVIP